MHGDLPTQQTPTPYPLFSETAVTIIVPPSTAAAQRQFWYMRLRAILAQVKALEAQRRALLQEASAIKSHFEGIDTTP